MKMGFEELIRGTVSEAAVFAASIVEGFEVVEDGAAGLEFR